MRTVCTSSWDDGVSTALIAMHTHTHVRTHTHTHTHTHLDMIPTALGSYSLRWRCQGYYSWYVISMSPKASSAEGGEGEMLKRDDVTTN